MLRERLTAHPRYVLAGEPWLDPRVRPHVAALAGPDGLARRRRRAQGLPWQEPDGGSGASTPRLGRTDLHATVDTDRAHRDRRSDFDDVYGDWDGRSRDRARAQARAASRGSTATSADRRSCARR